VKVIKKRAQPINHLKQRKQRQVERKRPPRVAATKHLRSRKVFVTKKRPQKAVVAKKSPSRLTPSKQKHRLKRVVLQKKKSPASKTALSKRARRTSVSPKSQHQRKASLVQKKQSSQVALKKTQFKKNLQQKKAPVSRNSSLRKPDYLSLLPYHDQQRAKDGGLDKLLSRDMKGQGQTVAVIELSGEWKALKDAANGKYGGLPPEIKANYKSNFLTPIGGPGLHPEQMNDWIRDRGDSPYHGSSVSSVVLDLTPQAKVLPVSTYYCRHSHQFYDTADALMDLSRRPDVSIINMSSGFTNFEKTSKGKLGTSETKEYLFKRIYPPKLTEAFKAVAKTGKVVVIAVGNEGKSIDVPQFLPDGHRYK
jgi:hypothetical protein